MSHTHDIQIQTNCFNCSSLRMQGTHGCVNGDTLCTRFIPAYAGNTRYRNTTFHSYPVHPCVCREHLDLLMYTPTVPGSSLRMQGTRIHRVGPLACNRFIPTYAGNTTAMIVVTTCLTVHPCVCREHLMSWCKFLWRCGSSLRMQGTPG